MGVNKGVSQSIWRTRPTSEETCGIALCLVPESGVLVYVFFLETGSHTLTYGWLKNQSDYHTVCSCSKLPYNIL
jgi:hypothetical protein